MIKTCAKCKLSQTIDNFYRKKQNKNGFDSYCKSCWRVTQSNSSKAKSSNQQYNTVAHGLFNSKQLNELLGNARKRASIRSLDFSLTTANVFNLLHEFCKNNYYAWGPKHPFKPSIDRIIPEKGYILENIRIIWLIENYCRNTFTDDDVLNFCKRKLNLLK